MSLKPVDRREIPEDTAQLGEPLLKEDDRYRQIGEKRGELRTDEDLAWMYSPLGVGRYRR